MMPCDVDRPLWVKDFFSSQNDTVIMKNKIDHVIKLMQLISVRYNFHLLIINDVNSAYRKVPNIRHTKSQNVNASRLDL